MPHLALQNFAPSVAPPLFLRRLFPDIPRRPLGLILLLVGANVVAWVLVSVPLRAHPKLVSPAALSYVLGLRHALDADHISAIDLTTRRLIAGGQRPVAVGTFFSLGHSTVVLTTCVVVAATSGALRERFGDFRRVGGIVGTAVSAAFLLLLCAGNGWVLWGLATDLRSVLAEERERAWASSGRGWEGDRGGGGGDVDVDADIDVDVEVGHGEGDDGTAGLRLEGEGFAANAFRKLFRLVDRPWKMLPLGVLFGLGFDTSSEIAILGIASIQAVQGTSIWLILIFPVLFTAGMCLLDTIDGALMMTLYTSRAFSRDRVAILYYSAALTGITVFVSAFVGIVQLLSLIQHVAEPGGRFWDGVGAIGDNFDVIGGGICGLFVLVGLASLAAYRPWRRQMERRARRGGGGGDYCYRDEVEGGEEDEFEEERDEGSDRHARLMGGPSEVPFPEAGGGDNRTTTLR